MINKLMKKSFKI